MARFPGAHVSEQARYERKHPEDQSGKIHQSPLRGRIMAAKKRKKQPTHQCRSYFVSKGKGPTAGVRYRCQEGSGHFGPHNYGV